MFMKVFFLAFDTDGFSFLPDKEKPGKGAVYNTECQVLINPGICFPGC